MRDRCGRPRATWRGFNEAEASLPRMPAWLSGLRNDGAMVASMRPRHLCLGCRSDGRLRPRCSDGASMRPRHLCLGCRSLGIIDPPEFVFASMRPRHLCLGCRHAPAPDRQRPDRASMRPRHLCLGCRVASHPMLRNRRCFNEAEASLPRMRPGLPSWRSASRSFNEAEASLPRMPWSCCTPSAARSRRFNEAEASLPRMPGQRHVEKIVPSAASMRPRHLCLGCPHWEQHARTPASPLQ